MASSVYFWLEIHHVNRIMSNWFYDTFTGAVRSFYTSRSDNYNESRSPTGGHEVIEIIYII
jgi:hypothetical protein